ncbi:hypothetical protein KIN20_014941 [Parelaphostrongylus tenuis]|uniref:Pre-rRNA-processing protein TSR1 homolog n=1 Tax=Parelaphostrongylus tenuis TaxID=148309 RepID=A0AAD5QNN2_PARTN|nr:hypothetical protein KIN20_014941 [Parelaphostrongylus tenuis]
MKVREKLLHDLGAARKELFAYLLEFGQLVGQHVTLQIGRVPVSLAQQWDQSAPMVLHQLLPHEQRMSVINLLIRRHPSCTVPIMNKQEFVATGSVLDVNPDRIVLERIVLSGHPFKINKRSVVCRYMFFHREDIEWFKPVELYTPSGRRGYIKEQLGTHGHMKCRFDKQLNAADSVMMSLCKRVFPKWTYKLHL